MLNADTIKKLIEMKQNEPDDLEFIDSCFDSFELYHRAVIDEQKFVALYGGGALDQNEFFKRRKEVDDARTMCHNDILISVNALNRMAEQAGLEPVYAGKVSKERPYRREVANAVFAYLEYIINNR
ncbi:MAG: DUF3232 domain-containing protein [Clostridia bacterium]|nr:DUF3232 domain-containing protein [Clostridia bacterium]